MSNHSEARRSTHSMQRPFQAMQPKWNVNLEEVIVLTDSDLDKINSVLEPRTNSLSRFAHKDVVVVARSTPVLSGTLKVQKAATKKVPRIIEFGVPDATISKLKGCVCCNAKWTTRKTATQKMNHMRTCARKHAYTSETVTILLKKEMSGADEPSPQPDTISENIHLRDLVQQKPPKKRKRSNVRSLIEEYSDAKRSTILKRAQAILRSPSPGPKPIITTRSSTSQIHENEAFRELPGPSSPQFRPSGLTCRYAASFTTIENRALPPTMEDRTNNTLCLLLTDTYSLDIQLPNAGTVAKLFYIYLAVHETMQQIKASSNGQISNIQLCPPTGGLSLDKKTKQKSSTKIRPVKATRVKRKQKPLEEWKKEFQSQITNDQDLCSRILRYEPIHFDALLNLAPAGYPLTKEVSTFLDEQGVTSFGLHKGWTRRRRRIRKSKL